MRIHNTLVFDEYVPTAGTAVYTSQLFNALLGQCDQLAWHVVWDNTSATTGNIKVELEVSADGRNWIAKPYNLLPAPAGAPPNLVNVDVVVNTPGMQAMGFDQGVVPMLGFCRFKISFTTVSGHVKVHASGRDQR